MKKLQFSIKILQEICNKHGLGKIQAHVYSQSGMVNPCVFINDQYVIRFNVRDPQIPKFRRERMAMQLLEEKKILVPKVIALDEERGILPHDFLICAKIEGQELHPIWNTLPSNAQQSLCKEMGEILAQIHQVTFPKFGAILPDGQKFDTWSACILDKLEEAISDAQKMGLFEASIFQQVRQVFDNHSKIFDTVEQAVLVHNDYHLGNMIADEGKIAGILDFEWCFAGDGEYDFRDTLTHEGVSEQILQGYQTIHPLSPEYPVKYHLYRLLLYLQLCGLAAMHDWGEESKMYYQRQFEGLLNFP